MNDTVSYRYLADGTKLSALTNVGDGLKYRGNFVYETVAEPVDWYDDLGNHITDPILWESLASIAWDEGRIAFLNPLAPVDSIAVEEILPDGGFDPIDTTVVDVGFSPDYMDEWHVRDHLGSVRAIVKVNGDSISATDRILEINDYLPFGSRIPTDFQASTNRHRFSGKEEQHFGSLDMGAGGDRVSLNLLDFGARYYDPSICRWTSIDPMAEKYYSFSPYNYCGGNPVNLVDPDGKRFYKKTVGNTIYISATYSANLKSSPSAQSAIAFWNNRKNDSVTIEGKTYRIKYKLSVKEDRFNRGTRIADNSYSVLPDSKLSELETGNTDETGRVIKVKESWANTNDKGKKSTTGAHEIGHTLGMHHDETGIMTPNQDESRTDEVTQQNLQQMIESGRGIPENPTVVDRIKQFFYDIFSQN